MPGLKERLITTGYSLGWSVVCKLPESWAQRAFQFFGDLAWRREGKLVRQLEANLVRVLGPDVDGKTLRDKWKDGPVTYLGVQSAGFPNLLMQAGSTYAADLLNTGSHDSLVVNGSPDGALPIGTDVRNSTLLPGTTS